MPFSHVGLTVAHLPTSCSFFLAALSPLGYRYLGQEGNQIAFGKSNAEFFISQESGRCEFPVQPFEVVMFTEYIVSKQQPLISLSVHPHAAPLMLFSPLH